MRRWMHNTSLFAGQNVDMVPRIYRAPEHATQNIYDGEYVLPNIYLFLYIKSFNTCRQIGREAAIVCAI